MRYSEYLGDPMEPMFRIEQKKDTATGCLIFLHGTADSGPHIGGTIRALKGSSARFPHIKVIFPTASMIPFSAHGGQEVNTWYDISDFTADAVENTEHIEKSAKRIINIINNEVYSGIPMNRIAIAGFSRGGAMSYYIGYSYLEGLAGVGVISSWLPQTSSIYEKLKKPSGHLPPLFQAHGGLDCLVKPKLAEDTVKIFETAGVKTQFKKYPNNGHEFDRSVLDDLYLFLYNVIPDE
ncbi:lysophospholipase-like protein 1 isoform X1 [Halyomorpha halys]|uniref:lysophospholipase-like protein 1 isoform X1 n=2 Tax=Halyomorpha halys TaxID=286706 RepID=UPI0006D50B1D|nr:lysophospholipase-like protein 1 isoform X1 [Halyomorpha halys]